MKKPLLLILILMLVGAVSAFAVDLKVTVPFDFTVGETTLSSGDYYFTPIGNYSAIQIRNFEKPVTFLTLSTYTSRMTIPEVITQWAPATVAAPEVPGVAASQPQEISNNGYSVIFTKYGEKYFLSKVWYGLQGRNLPETDAEHQLKMAGSPSDTVALIAEIH